MAKRKEVGCSVLLAKHKRGAEAHKWGQGGTGTRGWLAKPRGRAGAPIADASPARGGSSDVCGCQGAPQALVGCIAAVSGSGKLGLGCSYLTHWKLHSIEQAAETGSGGTLGAAPL